MLCAAAAVPCDTNNGLHQNKSIKIEVGKRKMLVSSKLIDNSPKLWLSE
jgi:hypothetical protein